jgi:hypothetical protein
MGGDGNADDNLTADHWRYSGLATRFIHLACAQQREPEACQV